MKILIKFHSDSLKGVLRSVFFFFLQVTGPLFAKRVRYQSQKSQKNAKNDLFCAKCTPPGPLQNPTVFRKIVFEITPSASSFSTFYVCKKTLIFHCKKNLKRKKTFSCPLTKHEKDKIIAKKAKKREHFISGVSKLNSFGQFYFVLRVKRT